jgi:hypothetical protein
MSKRSPEKPEGFPLNFREREALDHIAQGSIARPKGAGPQTITTLVSRKWIRRIGDDQYILTALGQVARDFDDATINAGFSCPCNDERAPGASAYKNLAEKLRAFENEISN